MTVRRPHLSGGLVLCAVLLAPWAGGAQTRSLGVQVKTSEGKTVGLYRGSYALVVGNGAYTHFDPLPGAVKDVGEVAAALEKRGFEVTLAKDLTREGFNRALAEFTLSKGRDPDNQLLFYYAGHGYTEKLATGEDLGYLVMIDAPDPHKDPVGFETKSVDMVSLVTQAKRIRAKHVLFMFDSCFSGSILNMRDAVAPKSISDNVSYPVRQFITAGRANEPVPDYSVFKQCFLDLLEGRENEPIPDGYITGDELGLFLKNKIPEYNSSQHPQFGKVRDPNLDKGDFVFVLGGPKPAPKVAMRSAPSGPVDRSEPTPAVTPKPPPDPEPKGKRLAIAIENGSRFDIKFGIELWGKEHELYCSKQDTSKTDLWSSESSAEGAAVDRPVLRLKTLSAGKGAKVDVPANRATWEIDMAGRDEATVTIAVQLPVASERVLFGEKVAIPGEPTIEYKTK